MNIWSKVFAGAILFFTLVFIVISALTMRTLDSWRTAHDRLEKQVLTLDEGGGGQPSLSDKLRSVEEERAKLHAILVDRGRRWQSNAARVDAQNPANGVVMQIESPPVDTIADKTIFYVFDAKARKEGGGYLGEFSVVGVDKANKQIAIKPTMKLSERELKQLTSSTGPWTLYETMPRDRSDLFAGTPQAELEAVLSPESVQEFMKDGQPAAANDPPERVVNGTYRRALRDYTTLFHELDRQMSLLRDEQAAALTDKASVEASVEDAHKQIAFHQQEMKDLAAELAELKQERDTIAAHRQALEGQLAKVQADIQSTLADNKRLAADFARRQLAAAAAIDRIAAPTP